MSEQLIAKGMAGHKHNFDRLQDIPSCPPADASAAEGTFYAFHDSDPPQRSDFQTAAERAAYTGKNECQRRANSIYSDLAALQQKVRELKKRHPLRYSFISAGHIRKEHGVLQRNERSAHCSFWICGRTSMHDLFVEKVL